MNLRILLAGTLLAGFSFANPAPLSAQTSAPAFRVPFSSTASRGVGSPIWAWMQSVSQCSSTCGSGTRSTSYVCQNISSYDYSGAGYGAPEADTSCVAGGAGAKPAASNASCTDYSGCSYTWVTPPVATTPVSDGGNPPGRAGCGMVNTVYSPYCQRSDGTVMSSGDYRFCSTSSGYNVNPSNPDTLGYNRTVVQTTSCTSADNAWVIGAWTGAINTCEANNVQTRAVTCTRTFDGTAEPDSACSAAKPAASQTIASYTSCSYSWSTTAWSASSNTCSSSATQTRAVTCMRSNDGGVATVDSDCTSHGAGAKPAASQTVADYSTCSYAWTVGSWSPSSNTCSASATQSRTVTCTRSNGDSVADSYCSAPKPATAQTIADYSTCSYSWQTGGWSASSNTCSASAVQTRSVTCMRSDGTAVGSGCAGAAPASSQVVSDYSGCGYSWQTGAWSAPNSGCSSAATETRSVWCQRSDGTVVGSGCAGAAPASSQTVASYGSCSYSWQVGGWGASSSTCSGSATQSRSVYCLRSDGAVVGSGCAGAAPASTQTVADYSGCGYSWQTGGWSGPSSTCSSAATETRSVWCQRSDGATVGSGCAGAAPAASQTVADYDGCSYSASYGTYSACSNGTQSRPVTCTRSDGAQVDPSYCGTSSTQTQSCFTNLQNSGSNCSCATGTIAQSWVSNCGSVGNDAACTTLDSQWGAACQAEGGTCYCGRNQPGRKTDPNTETGTCYR